MTNARGGDRLTVWSADNTAPVALGSVDLGADVVKSDVTFGSSGQASTMAASGSAVTVTLGTPSGGERQLDRENDPTRWAPSASLTDRAGNRCTTALVTESGPPDWPF